MRRLTITILFAVLLVGAVLASAQHPGVRAFYRLGYLHLTVLRYGITIRHDVTVGMPDGIRLATDLYLPRVPDAGLPAILVRLPYGKKDYGGALLWARRFAPEGYAVVLQDMRGRFGSEGVFTPYDHAVSDGVATLEWIAAQKWSNGRIATAGCSALGEHQAILAKARQRYHTAMIAEAAGGAIGRGGASRAYFGIYEGGIPNLATAFGWFAFNGGKTPDAMSGAVVKPIKALGELPSGTLVSRHRTTPTDYEDFLGRFEDNDYWARLGYLTRADRFAAPALHINTWHDPGLLGTFETATLMRANADTAAAHDHQHVIIGPGNHCAFDGAFAEGRVGDLPVDPSAALDYHGIYQAWLNHWLRDAPMPKLAQYTYYVLGADRWETSESWPPASSRPRRWYLTAKHGLSLEPAEYGHLSYRYDPMDPTPSLGGPICCTGEPDLRIGPIDQRPNALRSDILSFQSPPLTAPITLAGDIRAELAFSSDVPDTDLVAILIDIGPDGTMLTIQQGALRLRYRNGFDKPQSLPPGEIVTATVDMRSIAYELPAGHRIGLHLSSSSFPRLERNLNTAALNYLETEPKIAKNTVHFGGEFPSVLILPVQQLY